MIFHKWAYMQDVSHLGCSESSVLISCRKKHTLQDDFSFFWSFTLPLFSRDGLVSLVQLELQVLWAIRYYLENMKIQSLIILPIKQQFYRYFPAPWCTFSKFGQRLRIVKTSRWQMEKEFDWMTIALIERLSFAFTANVRLNLRNFQNER